MPLPIRPRRLRSSAIVREAIAETRLNSNMFVYPYFVVKGKDVAQPIDAMPGISRLSVDRLLKDAETGLKHGIQKVLLFGVGEEKSEDGHSSHDEHAIVADAVRALKKEFGSDLLVITDV